MLIPTVCIHEARLAYGKNVIFSNLNLQLSAGKWIGLLGPSGVGKSSLLRMIAGLLPSQGSIYIDESGVPVCASSKKEKPSPLVDAPLHPNVSKHIAYMAQTDLLLPWLNVLQNAALKLKLHPHTRKDHALELSRAKTLLNHVGLSHALALYPHQLSGGMRQRVALVRTWMEMKPIILMDEPFSALDAITRYKLQDLAVKLLQNKTVLFVTHDPAEALRLAHEIYIMQGQPASLKLAANLTSRTPRELNDPDVIKLQASLFHELTQAFESP